MTDALLRCLPLALQTPATRITPIAVGMSGAGVYAVDVDAEQFVLKVTSAEEPEDVWRRALSVQQAAATAGIAPRVVHVHDVSRAVLTERIVDRSIAAQLGNPLTRGATITALGTLMAALHALPVPHDLPAADPQAVLEGFRNAIPADFAMPDFVRQALAQRLDDSATVRTPVRVLSHNDVNPTNLVFDGARILVLDWQTAAPNDPYYDLGAIALFFRFDDASCRALIAAHDGAEVDALPEAFVRSRRFAALISGAAALHGARLRGHAGGAESLVSTPSLGELYALMRTGAFDLRSADGQWQFGLALVKEGLPTQ